MLALLAYHDYYHLSTTFKTNKNKYSLVLLLPYSGCPVVILYACIVIISQPKYTCDKDQGDFQSLCHRYSSRLAYAHTSAVISMVGYVLGLGDRHGENILFDSTTGDCIHVDFNCLFNRVSFGRGRLVVP